VVLVCVWAGNSVLRTAKHDSIYFSRLSGDRPEWSGSLLALERMD
jgi:hypothetical protein